MPSADAGTEAPAGGHVAAPGAAPPRATRARQGPFRSLQKGSRGGGRGGAGPFPGLQLGGVFLAGTARRDAGRGGGGGLAAREEAEAPRGCGPRAGPLSAGKGERGACARAATVENAARAGEVPAAQPGLRPGGFPGNPAGADRPGDRRLRGRNDHPSKMATPVETLPRGQPC